MGKTRTPALVVEFDTPPGVYSTPEEWRVRTVGQRIGFGAPTLENLARFVAKFNESLLPGGCNAHLGERARIDRAWIRRNTGDRKVLVTWSAPAANDNE